MKIYSGQLLLGIGYSNSLCMIISLLSGEYVGFIVIRQLPLQTFLQVCGTQAAGLAHLPTRTSFFFPPPKIFLNFVPYYFVWNPKCSFLPSVFTCAIPFSTVNYFFIRQCPIGLECHCEAFFKIPPDFIHFKCLTEPLLVRHRHTSFGFGVILLSC